MDKAVEYLTNLSIKDANSLPDSTQHLQNERDYCGSFQVLPVS